MVAGYQCSDWDIRVCDLSTYPTTEQILVQNTPTVSSRKATAVIVKQAAWTSALNGLLWSYWT